jgi:hypothetical protein
MRVGERGMRSVRIRRAVRMTFGNRRRGVVVVRRRRILAGEAIMGADQRDKAGDDRAKERQRYDSFVHARIRPIQEECRRLLFLFGA